MKNRFSLIRIVAVVLLLYSLRSLYASYSGICSAERVTAELENRLSVLREENAALQRNIEAARSGELLKQLAREQLGCIMPGERVFYFTEK